MKYQIELSGEQIRLIAQCLEDVSRFAAGQCELKNTIRHVLKDKTGEEFCDLEDNVDFNLQEVRNVLFPNLSKNSYKTYNSSEFIGNTYQIYRTILHQLAIDNNWNNVYSSKALPSGNLGTIKITKL